MTDAPPAAVTIYHNPGCGTSRNVLAMIRAGGVEPTVVEYLKTGWTRPQLEQLCADAGLTPAGLLRAKDAPAGLAEAGDAAILDAMVAEPKLVNRPIVVTPRGTALCRPSEAVLPLLDAPPASFTKEDGEVVRR